MKESKIKVAVYGYGNIGRGVEAAISKCPDMELVAIFTRRDPASIKPHGNNIPFPRDASGTAGYAPRDRCL